MSHLIRGENILLKEMDQEFNPTDFVYPVCLPDTAEPNYEHVRVNASGWGSLSGDYLVDLQWIINIILDYFLISN